MILLTNKFTVERRSAMGFFTETVFAIMVIYTVYCIHLACRTYINELRKGNEK